MRLSHRMLAVAWLGLALSAVPARAATGAAGHWEGKIQIPEHELAFSVDLDQSAKGEWIGSLSITGTSSVDVPLIKITVTGTAVEFVANLPGETSFAGTLSTDANSLTGKAANADGAAPFSAGAQRRGQREAAAAEQRARRRTSRARGKRRPSPAARSAGLC